MRDSANESTSTIQKQHARHPLVHDALLIAVSLVLVATGHVLVLQRTLHGPTRYLTIRADALEYVSMIDGNWDSAAVPFKHRVLVPLLARLLPLPPTESLRAISYGSLCLCYLFVLLTCSRLGFNPYVSIAGLVSAFVFPWHLYYYHNPFLTDAFGLMALSVMIWALMADSWLIFAVLTIVGVLARETTIFLVPVWCFRELKKGLVLTALAVLAFLAPRYFLASGQHALDALGGAIGSWGLLHLSSGVSFAKGILQSWDYSWLLAAIGMTLLPRRSFSILAPSAAFLLVGAFVAAVIATDTGRMFSIVMPLVAVAGAQVFAALIAEGHPVAAGLLLALSIPQAFLSTPNVVFGEKSWCFRDEWPSLMLSGVGTVCGLYSAFVLRYVLRREIREKTLATLASARRLLTRAPYETG